MSERREQECAPIAVTPGWGALPARLEATVSPLSAWSWLDTAGQMAGAVLGATVGCVLAAWLTPLPGYAPAVLTRAQITFPVFLLWALALTAGLSLAHGQRRRAPRIWRQRALRALGMATFAAVPATVAAVWWVPVHRLAFQPHLGWAVLGLAVGLGLMVGFPGERPWLPTLLAGGLGGLAAGAFAVPALASTASLPGFLAPLLGHAAILGPAAVLLSFAFSSLRELSKTRWLLVVFGPEQGRIYPLHRPLTLGTAEDNDLVLDPTGGVQPHHAVIRRSGDEMEIHAVDPTALVILRNTPTQMSELFDGDELQFGETVVRYYRVP